MARSPKTDQRARGDRGDRPLVSVTSILIFSGFLAGIACARVLPAAATPFLIGGAAAGVASWAGLVFVAERRRRSIARRVLHDASRRIDRRLDQHVPRRAMIRPSGPTRRDGGIHRQYMAVVRSEGRTYK